MVRDETEARARDFVNRARAEPSEADILLRIATVVGEIAALKRERHAEPALNASARLASTYVKRRMAPTPPERRRRDAARTGISSHITLGPSETRSRTPEVGRGRHRAIALALQIGLGAACVAGVFAGASAMLSALDSRDSIIRLGSIENWPEIKDGVPQLARQELVSGPLLASSAAPTPKIEKPIARELPGLNAAASSTEAITREPSMPKPVSAAVEISEEHAGAQVVLAQLRSAVPLPAVELDPSVLAAEMTAGAPTATNTELRETAPVSTSLDPGVSFAAEASTSSYAGTPTAAPHPLQATVPLPPRRPRGLSGDPRPKKVASVARGEPPPEQASVEPAEPAEDGRVHIFGMPLPSFIPNGRKIQDCVLEFRC